MNDPYTIPAHEHGVVRVFTTDLDAEGNAAITAENVQRLLGDGLDLDASRIEVFPSSKIDAIGLADYLREGYGIPAEDLEGKSSALNALKGLVILVASSAFRDKDATLDPKDGVRFVGMFSEPAAEPPRRMESAEVSETALQGRGTVLPPESTSRFGSATILIALVLAAVVILMLVF